METNTGLTFQEELLLTVRVDGKLAAVEVQNGHLERYETIEMTKKRRNEIFGVDRVQK